MEKEVFEKARKLSYRINKYRVIIDRSRRDNGYVLNGEAVLPDEELFTEITEALKKCIDEAEKAFEKL